MARSRRVSRIRKPRSVDSAAWRELRHQYGRNAREFNRHAASLIRDTNRALREQAREVEKRVRADERARIKETRAALRALRNAKLFEPPRSAFRIIQTKRGPRRLLKRSYLTRSPKLKAAIEEHAGYDPAKLAAYRLLLDRTYEDTVENAGTVHFATLPIERQLELFNEAQALHDEYEAGGYKPLGLKKNVFIAYH
jgi:hypothetical protein